MAWPCWRSVYHSFSRQSHPWLKRESPPATLTKADHIYSSTDATGVQDHPVPVAGSQRWMNQMRSSWGICAKSPACRPAVIVLVRFTQPMTSNGNYSAHQTRGAGNDHCCDTTKRASQGSSPHFKEENSLVSQKQKWG